MTDTQGSDGPVDEAAEALIAELLEAGFAYESNGRVAGLAEPEGDEDEGDRESGPGEGSEDSDNGSDGDGDGAADGDGIGGADGDTGGEPAGTRGAHSGRLELKGTPLTELEADNLLHLRQILIDHPELATEMEARLAGRTPAPPQQQQPAGEIEPPKLPEFIDPDDDTSVRLWQEIQEARSEVRQTKGEMAQATVEASQAKVNADVAAALDRFKVDHPDLTDAEINNIRNYTSANVNINGVMSNYPLDPVTGLVKSLEIGSMSDPSVRDKVLGIKRGDVGEQDRERQSNLSKLAGSSGAAARRPAAPKKAKSYNEAASMIAKELEALNGPTT